MKTKIAIILFSLLIVACSKGDKKAQLEALKKQRDNLTEQIKKLEAELPQGAITGDKKYTAVAINELKKQEFAHYIEIQGRLDGEDNLGVSAQTVGIVKNVPVVEGQAVKRDQILAQLDDAILQKSLAELQSRLEFAQTMYEKQKSLWEQKIGSEVQYLQAKNTKESLENSINTVKNQIESFRIKSPIDGVVEEVSIRPGQAVSPGLTFFRVVNFSRIKVVADISENYSSKIHKGDEVTLFFPDIDHEVKAKIDFSSKYINPVNRTFSIQIRFTPDKDQYRANMITVVRIKNYFTPNALVVPINAIQKDGNSSFVFVAEGAGNELTARKKIVKVGEESAGSVEILDGLKEGDKVVISGYQNLEDGTAIKLN